MTRGPIDERAVPFPFGKLIQEPTSPSLEERVRELEKKVFWLRDENEQLRKDNSSLKTQLRKFYP